LRTSLLLLLSRTSEGVDITKREQTGAVTGDPVVKGKPTRRN